MGKSREDELKVYLACRDMFANIDVGMKAKDVRKLFNKNQEEILSKVKGLDIDRIVTIVHDLHNGGVFKDPSRARKILRNLDVNQISESGTAPINSSDLKTPPRSEHTAKGIQPTTPNTAVKSKNVKFVHDDAQYLPISSQHLILNKVQQIVEETCFDHALKWLPDLLKDHGWYAPEAVELTAWPEALSMYDYPTAAAHLPDKVTIKKKLEDLRPLRNAAVHRLQIPAETVQHLMETALELVIEFQDSERLPMLEQLQDCLNDIVESLEVGRAKLRKDMNTKIKFINKEKSEVERQLASQLADLDQKSALAEKEMIEDDQNLRCGLDRTFKELYGQIFGTIAGATPMRPDYVTTQSCQQQSEEQRRTSEVLVDHNKNDYKGKGVDRFEDSTEIISGSTLHRNSVAIMEEPEVAERGALPSGLIGNVSRGSWKLIANILT